MPKSSRSVIYLKQPDRLTIGNVEPECKEYILPSDLIDYQRIHEESEERREPFIPGWFSYCDSRDRSHMKPEQMYPVVDLPEWIVDQERLYREGHNFKTPRGHEIKKRARDLSGKCADFRYEQSRRRREALENGENPIPSPHEWTTSQRQDYENSGGLPDTCGYLRNPIVNDNANPEIIAGLCNFRAKYQSSVGRKKNFKVGLCVSGFPMKNHSNCPYQMVYSARNPFPKEVTKRPRIIESRADQHVIYFPWEKSKILVVDADTRVEGNRVYIDSMKVKGFLQDQELSKKKLKRLEEGEQIPKAVNFGKKGLIYDTRAIYSFEQGQVMKQLKRDERKLNIAFSARLGNWDIAIEDKAFSLGRVTFKKAPKKKMKKKKERNKPRGIQKKTKKGRKIRFGSLERAV